MVSKEEFDKYLDELMYKDKGNENLKHLTKRRFLTSEFFGYSAFFAVFFSLIFVAKLDFIWQGMVCLLCGSLLMTLVLIRGTKTFKAKRYYEEYQKKIVEYLLKDYIFTLEKTKVIEEQIFLDSQFMGKEAKGYRGEDKLLINIPDKKGNYNLVLSDVNSFSKKNSFNGIFGYIELPYEFKCVLCINSTFERENLLLEPVELEDISFNESFKVLCDNQIEARYILTPDFMNAILQLKDNAKRLKITFADNRMYFAFVDMQLFKVNFVKHEEVTSMFSGFYEPVRACMDVLDEVKTNKKIFKLR